MAPYLHEGRRTSITEAIQWHGGEAEEQRKMFLKLKDNKKNYRITFETCIQLYALVVGESIVF